YDGPTGWGVPSGPLEATTGFQPATAAPSSVTPTSATLNGWVNPEGTETSYRFEYGPSKSYGSFVPASPVSVGTGNLWKPASQNVSLQPGVYHYRLVTTNKNGTRYGADQVLTLSRWKEEEPTWLLNAEDYYFTAASCSSTNTCMTVFSLIDEFTLGKPGPLPWPAAEQVQGTSWEAPVRLPRPAGEVNSGEIQGLSCPTAGFCQAVGWYRLEGGGRLPLAELWNGTTWEVKSLPETGAAILNGVSCASATSCLAVGKYWKNGKQVPLAELWDGTSWTSKSPNLPFGTEESVLTGVSCPTAGNCVASGFSCAHFCPGGTRTTLIERWTGSWAVEPSPNEGLESNELYGISCPTTSVCTAVGESSIIDGGWQATLAEHLENGVWSIQPTPSPTHYSSFGSEGCQGETKCGAPVSCPSVTECVATISQAAGGESEEEEAVERPRFAVWDGGQWQVQDARDLSYLPAPRESEPRSVTCAAVGQCLAVGRVGVFTSAFEIGGGFHADAWIAERLGIKVPIVSNVTTREVKATEAVLRADINPNGRDAHYQFEYGETAAYGQSVPASPLDLGSSSTTSSVSQQLTGLRPGTQYHFRVVVTGEEGSTRTPDATFTTGPRALWNACTKQAGGKFATAECAKEGSPNEWESLPLTSGQKTSITAKGAPIVISSTQSGLKLVFSCETEVAGASLENPNGLGNAEVKYKGCKPEGLAAEKSCKVENTANFPSTLELLYLEGKTQVILKPIGGQPFARFTISGCSITAWNHIYQLEGKMRGFYSNGASKIEFTSESTGDGTLTLFGQKATAVGSITLQASGGGAIRAE
ncbi:MAG TPA: fibronectin type III domain-containing protein, partial [Arthrobacter sp.]|nr:fibronectin type III domain-containing protein [Arthrobacter sp.]